MRHASVNLASRPFSNQAPVVRLAVVLGVLAIAVLTLDTMLYWSYFSGAGEEARDELAAVEARIGALESEVAELDREIAGYDVEGMRQQVEFLNLRIAERTFGWSRLFEDLGDVLPATVRLERLSPRLPRVRETAEAVSRPVLLTLEGISRQDEGVLEFIDALFAHPRFERPNPSRESRRDGELRFSLTVDYLPPSATESESESPPEAGGEAS